MSVSALRRQTRGRGHRRMPGRRRRQVRHVPRDDVGNGPDSHGRPTPASRGAPEERRVEDDVLALRTGSNRLTQVVLRSLNHLMKRHPGRRRRRGSPAGTPSGQAPDRGLPLHAGGSVPAPSPNGGGVCAIMRMPHYDHVGITIHDWHGGGGGGRRGFCGSSLRRKGCGRRSRSASFCGLLPRSQSRRRRRSTGALLSRQMRSMFRIPLPILLTILDSSEEGPSSSANSSLPNCGFPFFWLHWKKVARPLCFSIDLIFERRHKHTNFNITFHILPFASLDPSQMSATLHYTMIPCEHLARKLIKATRAEPTNHRPSSAAAFDCRAIFDGLECREGLKTLSARPSLARPRSLAWARANGVQCPINERLNLTPHSHTHSQQQQLNALRIPVLLLLPLFRRPLALFLSQRRRDCGRGREKRKEGKGGRGRAGDYGWCHCHH